MTETKEPIGMGRLFNGERQFENFARLQFRNRVTRMPAAPQPYQFAEGSRIDLPETYQRDGAEVSLAALLADTDTAALIVLRDGAVRFEQYWLTGGRDVQWLSMSVAKSFVSALVSIMLAEGLIDSLDDPITRYASDLAGSAYDGVSIRDVLRMSSGARWNEDYADPRSEIYGLGAALASGGSYDAFMKTMVRETEPGSVCQYNSADTQALGMLVRGATGGSLTDYMRDKLYGPLRMESEGFWITDSQGVEMAFAGLLMTARDFAKLGELYRNSGVWEGRQLVPAEYVAASISYDAPQRAPGRPLVGGHPFPLGYGYQWWLPEGDRGEFSAIGVYNQYVYVDPSRGIVIVKLSANPRYGLSHEDADNKDMENIHAFRAICQQFD